LICGGGTLFYNCKNDSKDILWITFYFWILFFITI
jgi:hypothetical protein